MLTHTDERAAADTVLSVLWVCEVSGDKGFLGADGLQGQWETQGNRIWTPTRVHQHPPHAPAVHRGLHRPREHIDSTFHAGQHMGCHRECLLRKTVLGLVTHVIAKITSHTLKHLLRHGFGIDVQT